MLVFLSCQSYCTVRSQHGFSDTGISSDSDESWLDSINKLHIYLCMCVCVCVCVCFFLKKKKSGLFNIERQMMTLSLFCVSHLLLGMRPCIPSETLLEENNFFICKCLSIGDSFWVTNGVLYSLLLWLGCYLVHAAIVSVSFYVHWFYWFRRSLM